MKAEPFPSEQSDMNQQLLAAKSGVRQGYAGAGPAVRRPESKQRLMCLTSPVTSYDVNDEKKSSRGLGSFIMSPLIHTIAVLFHCL